MLSGALGLQIFGAPKWTPRALGPSLRAWWDAERPDLITQSGGSVSSWKDIVAGYDAAQSVGASKPTYSATSFNSRPGVSFDGVDDYVGLTGVPPSFPIGAAPSELWQALDQTIAGTDLTIRFGLAYGAGSGTLIRRIGRTFAGSTNRAYVGAGDGTATNTVLNSAIDYSGRHVVRGIIDGTNAYCEADGNLSSAVASVPATASTAVRIGANLNGSPGGFLGGVVSAALITGPLTTTQASLLRAYLNRRL